MKLKVHDVSENPAAVTRRRTRSRSFLFVCRVSDILSTLSDCEQSRQKPIGRLKSQQASVRPQQDETSWLKNSAVSPEQSAIVLPLGSAPPRRSVAQTNKPTARRCSQVS